jgi:hypothetical protein
VVNRQSLRNSDFDFDFELEAISRVEVGSNTSTVALRVVEGDKKRCFKSETVKYGRVTALARTSGIVNDRPVLSSERAPHINKPANI